MADNIIIPRLYPMSKDTAQAGTALMSAHESHMAMQTTALWHAGTGAHKTFFWPVPGDSTGTNAMAPRAGFTNSNFTTVQEFYPPGYSVGGWVQPMLLVPWLVHPRIEQIHVRAIVALDSGHGVVLTGVGGKLSEADTISPVDLPDSERSDKVSNIAPMGGKWTTLASTYGYDAFVHLKTSFVPAVPSSPTHRMITIRPQLQWADSAFPYTTTVYMYLVMLEIYEELEAPTT